MLLRKIQRQNHETFVIAGEIWDHNNMLCPHKGCGDLGDSENGIFPHFQY